MIVITGASGFIGSNLTNYFIKKCKIFRTISIRSGHRLKFNFDDKVIIHLSALVHDTKLSNFQIFKEANFEITKEIFENFLNSEAKDFIFISSVKAAADSCDQVLNEDFPPNPSTPYGISKLLAENYLLSKEIPKGKRIIILRPCMVHGPLNKGNLNQLDKFVRWNFPWPLASYENKRSFCSIDNLCFIINEIIEDNSIPSGIYNVADDSSISTNELIYLIARIQGKKLQFWRINKRVINSIAKVGSYLKLPINSEMLYKLTGSYVVSNSKIKNYIKKPLPISLKEGLVLTIKSFES